MLGTFVLCFAGVIRTVLVEAAAGMSGRSGTVPFINLCSTSLYLKGVLFGE